MATGLTEYPPMTPEVQGYPQVLLYGEDFTEAVTGCNHNEASERPPVGSASGPSGQRVIRDRISERSATGSANGPVGYASERSGAGASIRSIPCQLR
jgi:hypothetical protein